MLACTTANQLPDTATAIADAANTIRAKNATAPDFILAAYSEHHSGPATQAGFAAAFPDTPVLGSSTCRGVMTNEGLFGFGNPAMALTAFWDDDADFGTAAIAIEDAANFVAIKQAVQKAQRAACRAGEVPDIVWLHASPGSEEIVIAGIQEALGDQVLISGGSSADETISGRWSQFSGDHGPNCAVLALIYRDQPIIHHFQNGYLPTSHTGTATRAAGRTLFEIDHQPAAEVYDRWAQGAISHAIADNSQNILGATAWQPLGKSIGRIGPSPDLMVDQYCLVHPDSVGPGGALKLFADVPEGSPIVMMKSGQAELIKRAKKVVETSFNMAPPDDVVAAGVMVFCAGCMLALDDKITQAAKQIRNAYADVPFMGIFTFGEQGSFPNGTPMHGNLMISSTLFSHAGKGG